MAKVTKRWSRLKQGALAGSRSIREKAKGEGMWQRRASILKHGSILLSFI